MKDGFVKVAACTPKLKLADCAANAQAHLAMMQEAADQGVKLVCFPELSLTGYTCGDLFFARPLLTAAQDALAQCGDMRARLFQRGDFLRRKAALRTDNDG